MSGAEGYSLQSLTRSLVSRHTFLAVSPINFPVTQAPFPISQALQLINVRRHDRPGVDVPDQSAPGLRFMGSRVSERLTPRTGSGACFERLVERK